MIAAFPHTGRTHQIRVHTQLAGHPILGDDKYGNRKAKRLCLHARKLNFVLNGETFNFEAPYDEKFNEILRQLRDEKSSI